MAIGWRFGCCNAIKQLNGWLPALSRRSESFVGDVRVAMSSTVAQSFSAAAAKAS